MNKHFGSEEGAVLIIVTAFMVAAIALVTLVIDVGHWFEHKRHLQAQVDAGTFNGCFAAGAGKTDPNSAANLAIENAARKYAGDTNNVANAYNAQVNNKANVTVLLNSTNYASGGGTNYSDPAGPPCAAGYIDVKATDANVPWFLAKKLVPAIDAHARVSILQIASLAGSLPLAVRDVSPLDAGAIFVNEDVANFQTSLAAVLGRRQLTAGANQLLNGVNVTAWTGGPVSVTVPSRSPDSDVGVVMAVCSNPAICGPSKGTAWLTGGTVAAVCGQLYVSCFNSDQTGLDFIHGYSTTGTGSATAPIVRDVSLTSGNCTDDSAPYFLLNGGCKVGVQAQLDFGVTGDPSLSSSLSATATLTAASGGSGTCTLSYVSSSGTTSTWSASTCLTITSGAGQAHLTLNWTTGTGKAKVTGSFANVARPFANDGAAGTFFTTPGSGSYPIAYAQVSRGASCASGLGNSVPSGATNFCVGIGVMGNLKIAADTTDPAQILKFIGSNGSHSGAINCGGGTLRDDIVNGCTTPYQRNSGEACPNSTTPADCALIRTGQKVGQARQGMNDRFAPGGVCPANNWSQYPNIPSGDPRVVPLIVTLSDAFDGSGSGYVPVTDFAAFYVTGWDGATASCNGINQSAPPGAGNGTIWGHFIKYVGDLGNSTGGSACTFSASLSPCIPVLTQ
jgi:Putative Flp pilus-assembly TadE/G-like